MILSKVELGVSNLSELSSVRDLARIDEMLEEDLIAGKSIFPSVILRRSPRGSESSVKLFVSVEFESILQV